MEYRRYAYVRQAAIDEELASSLERRGHLPQTKQFKGAI